LFDLLSPVWSWYDSFLPQCRRAAPFLFAFALLRLAGRFGFLAWPCGSRLVSPSSAASRMEIRVPTFLGSTYCFLLHLALSSFSVLFCAPRKPYLPLFFFPLRSRLFFPDAMTFVDFVCSQAAPAYMVRWFFPHSAFSFVPFVGQFLPLRSVDFFLSFMSPLYLFQRRGSSLFFLFVSLGFAEPVVGGRTFVSMYLSLPDFSAGSRVPPSPLRILLDPASRNFFFQLPEAVVRRSYFFPSPLVT